MSTRKTTDLVNVDFWADRIAAVIKLAEHYSMTVEITDGDLAVSRQVSEAFIARTEVQWRAAPPDDEAQQGEEPKPDSVLDIVAAWYASSEGRDVLIEDLADAGYRLPTEEPS